MKKTDLVKELEKYNIRVRQHKKPLSRAMFTIMIHRDHPEGTVLVNQGLARVKVNGNKQLRQAAVTVKERGRVLTRKVIWNYRHARYAPDPAKIKSELIQRFPVNMPKETNWTVEDVKVEEVKPEPPNDGITRKILSTWIVVGMVTAKVNDGTTNHFLLGMDESHHFIAPLAKHADSVREAHRMLRPEGLKKNSKRQGEWFFEPCNRKMQARLNQHVGHHPGQVQVRRLGGDTTHVAKSTLRWPAMHRISIYARGYVVDDRQGHHKALWLPSWHRVVKNKETVMQISPEQQEAAAARRRMRSFD